MSTPANFNGARPVIDVNDTAMLLIDHQSGLFQTVGDMPMPELRARAAALAKMASLAGIPVITTASVPQGPNGPLIPEIHEVMTYKQALEFAKQLDVKLIPYELAKGMKETREILSEIKPGQSVGIFIGPEGGFEEEEVAKALEAGAHAITLGRRILRTETAGLAILSVLMFQLENE